MADTNASEFLVVSDDGECPCIEAQTSGPRDVALREAMHYAAQYAGDGSAIQVIEQVEVARLGYPSGNYGPEQQATPQPADAALADDADWLIDAESTFHKEQDYIKGCTIQHLQTACAEYRKAAARLRALSQPATPVAQVPEFEAYSADVTNARDFRIIASPDLSDYVLQWQITDGTIMTITSVKVSREGLAHTIGVIDRVRDALPIAAAQSAKGGE